MTTIALLKPRTATYNRHQIDDIGDDRLESMLSYIDALVDQHASLVIVHLEATYLPEYRELMIPTILEITKERFLDGSVTSQDQLDPLVGYLWTVNHIEDDTDSDDYSLCQHFVLIFDASALPHDDDLNQRLVDRFHKISLGTATCRVVDLCLRNDADSGDSDNRPCSSTIKNQLIQRVRELMGTTGLSPFGSCALASHAGERVTFDRLRRLMRAQTLSGRI